MYVFHISLKTLQLNGYDKLYLLMSKWKLLRLFNPLCFAGNVTSIEDLESRVNTNLEDLRRKLPGWTISSAFNDDVNIIEKMIEDSKTVKFEDLPFLLVSKLHITVELRTVPTFVTVRTFYASRDTRVSYGTYMWQVHLVCKKKIGVTGCIFQR